MNDSIFKKLTRVTMCILGLLYALVGWLLSVLILAGSALLQALTRGLVLFAAWFRGVCKRLINYSSRFR